MIEERRSGERELLRAELDRLREAATEVRSDLTDEVRFAKRKLAERDDELRAAREEIRAAGDEWHLKNKALERERDDWRLRAREAEDALETRTRERDEARRAHASAERHHERLRNRQVVRVALQLAALFAPLFAFVRRIRNVGYVPPARPLTDLPRPEPPSLTIDVDEEVAREMESDALVKATLETLPPVERTGGPQVSIVVLNRNGEHHLRRLLPGLAETAYADFDVTIVDNASDDGSVPYARRFASAEGRDFPLRVIRNDDNASFSAGNNEGVAATQGKYVLLLNNDVTPMEPTWLARLVDAAVETGAAAVGARLVYPVRPDLDNVGDTVHPDLSIQHRGIHYVHTDDGIPLPRNAGSGEDPFDTAAVTRHEVPAATAACLLVRRDAFDGVGGLSDAYVYGTEDVDLCLKLRAAGHDVVFEGSAVLWHHEFGTQNLEGGEFKGANRRENRRRFVARWGPRVYREVLRDRLLDAGHWSEEPLQIVAAEADDPDAARADAIVVHDHRVAVDELPRHVPVVGIVDGDASSWLDQPWFDDLDVVLAASDDVARRIWNASSKVANVRPPELDEAAAVRDALFAWVNARRVAILISTPSPDVAEWWGDTHYARALQRHFERRGHPARIVLRDEFDAPWVSQADVAVHLLGLTEHTPRPGQVSVLWNISHPELATPDLVAAYDLAFVASRSFAAELDGQVDIPVLPLRQATDAEKFSPDPDGPHHELLFVANSRQTRRAVVDALVPTRFDLAVYGGDWFPDLIDPRHVRDEVVPNDALPAYYTNADVVLNDHWPEMRRYGFISNRIYDAFAAGGFVVSDDVDGLEEEFDGAVVTFTDRDDLHATLERFLGDARAREEHARTGRRAVLKRHTFAHRVEFILEHLGPLLAARPASVVPFATSLAARRAV